MQFQERMETFVFSIMRFSRDIAIVVAAAAAAAQYTEGDIYSRRLKPIKYYDATRGECVLKKNSLSFFCFSLSSNLHHLLPCMDLFLFVGSLPRREVESRPFVNF